MEVSVFREVGEVEERWWWTTASIVLMLLLVGPSVRSPDGMEMLRITASWLGRMFRSVIRTSGRRSGRYSMFPRSSSTSRSWGTLAQHSAVGSDRLAPSLRREPHRRALGRSACGGALRVSSDALFVRLGARRACAGGLHHDGFCRFTCADGPRRWGGWLAGILGRARTRLRGQRGSSTAVWRCLRCG